MAMNEFPFKPKWESADHLVPLVTEHLHLARMGESFYFTFGRLRPPGPGDEEGPKDAPRDAAIEPVVRILLRRDAVEQFARFLKASLEDEGHEGGTAK